ncbi:N-acetyl-gamma-glutamyl-phosphate reductase [Candidatus Woesearchaeota archaeon]|nr:N-acetyl-gamma-glutamyl-phosphate reductase [Candidatus Woesearchaeota archaeon]
MIKVAVVGATGFVGCALLKLLEKHSEVDIGLITSTSHVGKPLSELQEEFSGTPLGNLVLSVQDPALINQQDVAFLAVPHGTAEALAKNLTCKVIDLSADQRLTAVYGLPEAFSKQISHAQIVGNPGCYATACILAALPLKNHLKSCVFDCISGYSGAGKNAHEKFNYAENIIAYHLADHLHLPEIKKALGCSVSFTPHVVNAFSGLMCTAHLNLKETLSLEAVQSLYESFYKDGFTTAVSHIPSTKEVVGTPFCHIGGFAKDENGLVVVSVIDNLMKGAASQAIENFNLMFGFNLKEGLL